MPTYEYACTSCGHRLEAHQSFSDDPLTTCPECSGSLRKVFGSVGIVLKGPGFYRTDSRNGSGTARTPKDTGKAAAGSEGSPAGSTSGSSGSDSSTSGSSGSGSSGSGSSGSNGSGSTSGSGGSGSTSGSGGGASSAGSSSAKQAAG